MLSRSAIFEIIQPHDRPPDRQSAPSKQYCDMASLQIAHSGAVRLLDSKPREHTGRRTWRPCFLSTVQGGFLSVFRRELGTFAWCRR